jgi:hypothetical protein
MIRASESWQNLDLSDISVLEISHSAPLNLRFANHDMAGTRSATGGSSFELYPGVQLSWLQLATTPLLVARSEKNLWS